MDQVSINDQVKINAQVSINNQVSINAQVSINNQVSINGTDTDWAVVMREEGLAVKVLIGLSRTSLEYILSLQSTDCWCEYYTTMKLIE